MYIKLIRLAVLAGALLQLISGQTLTSWGCYPQPPYYDYCENNLTTVNGNVSSYSSGTCSNSRNVAVQAWAAAISCEYPIQLSTFAGKYNSSMLHAQANLSNCSPDFVNFWECTWSVDETYGGCSGAC